jgi:hypothetical protein
VRTDKGEIVITGDSRYLRRTSRERCHPRFVFCPAAMLASLDRREVLEKGGAKRSTSFERLR